ncbi:hypothetical protein EFM55_06615 [Lactiplantibacillus pentosus]|nr:hypothetical protein [Lactiplantibacillus pentosus]
MCVPLIMDKKAPNSTNTHSNARQARKLPFTSDIYQAYIHLLGFKRRHYPFKTRKVALFKYRKRIIMMLVLLLQARFNCQLQYYLTVSAKKAIPALRIKIHSF